MSQNNNSLEISPEARSSFVNNLTPVSMISSTEKRHPSRSDVILQTDKLQTNLQPVNNQNQSPGLYNSDFVLENDFQDGESDQKFQSLFKKTKATFTANYLTSTDQVSGTSEMKSVTSNCLRKRFVPASMTSSTENRHSNENNGTLQTDILQTSRKSFTNQNLLQSLYNKHFGPEYDFPGGQLDQNFQSDFEKTKATSVANDTRGNGQVVDTSEMKSVTSSDPGKTVVQASMTPSTENVHSSLSYGSSETGKLQTTSKADTNTSSLLKTLYNKYFGDEYDFRPCDCDPKFRRLFRKRKVTFTENDLPRINRIRGKYEMKSVTSSSPQKEIVRASMTPSTENRHSDSVPTGQLQTASRTVTNQNQSQSLNNKHFGNEYHLKSHQLDRKFQSLFNKTKDTSMENNLTRNDEVHDTSEMKSITSSGLRKRVVRVPVTQSTENRHSSQGCVTLCTGKLRTASRTVTNQNQSQSLNNKHFGNEYHLKSDQLNRTSQSLFKKTKATFIANDLTRSNRVRGTSEMKSVTSSGLRKRVVRASTENRHSSWNDVILPTGSLQTKCPPFINQNDTQNLYNRNFVHDHDSEDSEGDLNFQSRFMKPKNSFIANDPTFIQNTAETFQTKPVTSNDFSDNSPPVSMLSSARKRYFSSIEISNNSKIESTISLPNDLSNINSTGGTSEIKSVTSICLSDNTLPVSMTIVHEISF